MKITIPKGTTLENALEHVKNLLAEQYSEYPLLNKDINIYVTLKDEKGKLCPDNKKEYFCTKDGFVDVLEQKISQAKKETIEQWKYYLEDQKLTVFRLQKAVSTDTNYFETAVEKNRKPENIEKRKTIAEENKKKLERRLRYVEKLERLNTIFQERPRFYIQQCLCGGEYSYTLTINLLFKDIDGKDYYFSEGYLNKGIPEHCRISLIPTGKPVGLFNNP